MRSAGTSIAKSQFISSQEHRSALKPAAAAVSVSSFVMSYNCDLCNDKVNVKVGSKVKAIPDNREKISIKI